MLYTRGAYYIMSFAYFLSGVFFLLAAVGLLRDAVRDSERALILRLGHVFLSVGLIYTALGAGRVWLVITGEIAPWLASPMWALPLLLGVAALVAFWAAVRDVRR